MPRKPVAETLGDLENLARSVTPETFDGQPQLKTVHDQLQHCIETILRLVSQRDFHEARRREATDKIQGQLEEGRRLATLLQAMPEDDPEPA
jgi:hypothetical protein